ncbi:MAG TPA: ATP synthase subunit I [Clostridia bacterium]|nr:ATP synthase subunit I [Clostridia bacterium]
MSKLSETRNNVIKWTFVAGFVIIVIILIMIENQKFQLIAGVIFGTLIGILNFLELEKTLIKSAKMTPNKAQSYATKKYFLRYGIAGVVLLISIKASYINIAGTVIGLLLLKFVIMFTNLFNDKKYFKRIIGKEE